MAPHGPSTVCKRLFRKEILVGAVGIALLVALQAHNLLILRKGKREQNCKNAEPRYTPGTQDRLSFDAGTT